MGSWWKEWRINHVLSVKSKPALLKRPVMVMGADVSHPAPESRGSKPSIAAIVGSIEPKAANYQVEVRVQEFKGVNDVSWWRR